MTKSVTNIKKILIANRGEIACRVIKTARKMGIATVAVYSDADRKALHVRLADEAVHIGPSPAVESYLVIEKIIAAAKETGADAVHPGYGFLSENPDFVRACERAGLIFIGPSAEAMEAMGLKDAAKKLMDEAGVPITPGYHGKDQSPKLLKAKAGMIGYPVLIKAVAGGGGKGMRKVEADTDFDAALASCKREAASSFGNEDVLIEKYIQSPRHIEVQVFGDSHGNVVHMFERDCSLQRRHQKVIEEAPAPGMTDSVRKAMTDAAIKAAKAVNYVGAGTVEFIVDGSGKLRTDGFWFMEMNTRLQVEHPVTEMITGLDLVEWQIRVARGEELLKQDTIEIRGHSVEARIYAEDPANDFLPSIGRVTNLDLPDNYDRGMVRQDMGIATDDAVSIFYDPMVGKLISNGRNRNGAIASLSRALFWTNAIGLKTNISFVSRVLNHPTFIKAEHTTNFIADEIETLVPKDFCTHPSALAYAAVAILNEGRNVGDNAYNSKDIFTPWANRDAWRLNSIGKIPIALQIDGETAIALVQKLASRDYMVSILGEEIRVELSQAPKEISVPDNLRYFYSFSHSVFSDRVEIKGESIRLTVKRADNSLINSTASPDTITAPMPGKIIALNVAIGDTVSEGDALVVMEAMKMEQTLTAPRDGVVAEVGAELGELVTDGAVLVSLEKEEKK
jgi:3-methylcrotonyl-CoA carboxylase alpha subunit